MSYSSLFSGSPSKAASAKSRVTFLKSIIVKYSLFFSSTSLVPLPIICLNSIMLFILLSITINSTVLVSTPVDKSLEVVTKTG